MVNVILSLTSSIIKTFITSLVSKINISLPLSLSLNIYMVYIGRSVVSLIYIIFHNITV